MDELRKLGWVEGTTIVIERKDPAYRLDLLPALAADLVRSNPNLIVAVSPFAARAAKNATSDIPIVMLFVADPVGIGLASSLAHPGGNLTDVASMDRNDFGGKQLGFLPTRTGSPNFAPCFLSRMNSFLRMRSSVSQTHSRKERRRSRLTRRSIFSSARRLEHERQQP